MPRGNQLLHFILGRFRLESIKLSGTQQGFVIYVQVRAVRCVLVLWCVLFVAMMLGATRERKHPTHNICNRITCLAYLTYRIQFYRVSCQFGPRNKFPKSILNQTTSFCVCFVLNVLRAWCFGQCSTSDVLPEPDSGKT